MTNIFGQTLREKRLEKGFGLRQFAGMVGISPTYLSRVELGTIEPPTAARVMAMAEALEDGHDELMALGCRGRRRLLPDLLDALHGGSDKRDAMASDLEHFANVLKDDGKLTTRERFIMEMSLRVYAETIRAAIAKAEAAYASTLRPMTAR